MPSRSWQRRGVINSPCIFYCVGESQTLDLFFYDEATIIFGSCSAVVQGQMWIFGGGTVDHYRQLMAGFYFLYRNLSF